MKNVVRGKHGKHGGQRKNTQLAPFQPPPSTPPTEPPSSPPPPPPHTLCESSSMSFEMCPLTDCPMRKRVSKDVGEGGSGIILEKLRISDNEIGLGSRGSAVYEGTYEGYNIAAKRLLKSHHKVNFRELEILRVAHENKNVIGFYGVHETKDFYYLILQRCDFTLYSFILYCSESTMHSTSEVELKILKEKISEDMKLWTPIGRPTSLLIDLMSDIVNGLVYLHDKEIVHGDLKPRNVLINTNEGFLRAKLSDMGISKHLLTVMTFFSHSQSKGWKAPEIAGGHRQTNAVDLFSLGCVLFFCISGGERPFGVSSYRESNIASNNLKLFLIEHIKEAVDVISCLLDPNPELRPKATTVMRHPLLWKSKKRMLFLQEVSDKVQSDRGGPLSKEIESMVVYKMWDKRLGFTVTKDIFIHRNYNGSSTCDLLRAIRNMLHHYGDLPQNIQELLGPVPEGFDDYIASRYPDLLIEVYTIVSLHFKEEQCFQDYF
ncbi:serine/threonine-protein kinase/endoribonuclease IRE1a-like isoform X1 [Tasmannia lanceolata]|uniref:serine/threonine-protein kinase/endoribonuclease IRE1a-like isoform X1 n=1 Tax=Tasmannia lanceolata TaxID=3420 RepID=UPI004064AEF2